MSTLAAAGAQDAAVIQNDVSAPADGDGAARVGDMLDPDGVPAQPTASTVREKLPNGDGDSKESAEPSKPSSTPNPNRAWPTALAWIPKNWTWASARTVLRCSLMGWASLVLLMIGRLERAMGIASFLILVAAFLSPPAEPFMVVLEREMLILLFSTAGWAWSCLAIKLASLARTRFVPTAPQTLIFSGEFIETGPTVIFAVFLFFGTAFFLYMKARMGPGPYIFASVFGCICLVINLSTAHFFPYAYYVIGQAVIIPLALHSALALAAAAFIFPVSVSTQFLLGVSGVLGPLQAALTAHQAALKLPRDGAEPYPTRLTAAAAPARTNALTAENGLVPLRLAARLLPLDAGLGRFRPADLDALADPVRRLAVRAHGLGLFYFLVDPADAFPTLPVDRPDGDGTARAEGSPERRPDTERVPVRESASRSTTLHGGDDAEAAHHHRLHERLLHLAAHPHLPRLHVHTPSRLFGLSPTGSRAPSPPRTPPVGTFEARAYSALHARHTLAPAREDPAHGADVARATAALASSAVPLLSACADAVGGAQAWLAANRGGALRSLLGIRPYTRDAGGISAKREALERELRDFRGSHRLCVLEPWRAALDPERAKMDPDAAHAAPAYRYLFHCYYYQFHLARFAQNTIDLLAAMETLDAARTRARLWLPIGTLMSRLHILDGDGSIPSGQDDENPDTVQGVDAKMQQDLGAPAPRDPDALPPRNAFEAVARAIHSGVLALGRGNVLFALKAGLLTILLTLPFYLKSSAAFAYKNRFIWAVIMGQLTLARFRGDTVFGLTARIIATFLGGVTGIVIWYISAGTGHGNPYALGAVCAVCFPMMYYGRLYWPGPPMTNIVFFVTSVLIIGYSWQDTHNPSAVNPGYGISVGWKRFVLVTVGVFASFIFSYLPPSTTLRAYQRRALATTSAELGTLYCSIVSFTSRAAHDAPLGVDRAHDTVEIVRALIAVRAKLKRSLLLKTNIVYEFSFRGAWPAARWQKVLELQLQAAYLLSHLMSAVEQLDAPWARAFLHRTRFLDGDFQGDVLAVISLISTSLRTGQPLPQVTPCPLLDRFMRDHHRFPIPSAEARAALSNDGVDEKQRVQDLTLATLEDEQYLTFSVAVTTAFHVVAAIDRIMLATKELVGEQYHIHGLRAHTATDGRPTFAALRPGRDA